MTSYIDEFLRTLKASVSGFKSFTIASIKDGTVLNSVKDPSYIGNPEMEAAFQLEIFRQATKALEISSPGKAVLTDIVIETEDLTYLLALSNAKKFFAVLIFDSRIGSLGMARAVIAKGKSTIGERLDAEL